MLMEHFLCDELVLGISTPLDTGLSKHRREDKPR
jgi:hypothetical protein